ncbi:MAG: hypothetical protein OEW24_07450 [Chloroflexota bacterium]|nr:hypothetical protein [Chloroflexota bacterium]
MHRPAPIIVLLLFTVLAACAPSQSPSARPSGSSPPAGSPAMTATGSPIARRELPSGFPVIAGAVALSLPNDDLGLIARWTSDVVGAPVYDFYLRGLPAAGYPIEGLYPGDGFAVIRFSGRGDEVWQLIMQTADLVTTQIEVRLDRP